MTAQLHTNQQPRQLAVNKKEIDALVDLIANRVMEKIDQREQHRMISNAVQQGVAKHLEAQRTAAKPAEPAEPEDIFDNYKINPDAAATYMNSKLEQK